MCDWTTVSWFPAFVTEVRCNGNSLLNLLTLWDLVSIYFRRENDESKLNLNTNALTCLCYLFIYPYMTYCNHIWGTAPVSSLNMIVVFQKRAIRIICNVNRRASTDKESSVSLMSMFTWYLDSCSDISMDSYLLCLPVTSKPMLIFIVIILGKPFISISRMLKATLVK